MPLNPPEVGRLSICSTSVEVQHQLPGAEVTIHVDGTPVPLGQANTAWEVMNLPPGLQLRRDQRVVATQELNGETSPPGVATLVQGVGAFPSKPQPHPDSHIYECASLVALAGLTPGSTVEVLSGSTVIGSTVTATGAAAVDLSRPVPLSPALHARATTCGQPPVTVTLPRADRAPVDQENKLPAPIFGSPLMACLEWIRVDGAIPGATVVLTRGDGSSQRQRYATSSWPMRLNRPLEDGERLVLHQEFDLCKFGGHDRSATVGPLVVGPPTLATSWCDGRIGVIDLVPGATLIFFAADGTEIGRSGVVGTTGQFTVDQPHSPTIFARQEVCGVLGARSNSVDAMTGSHVDLTPPSPEIAAPVLACQTELTVRGLRPGGGQVEIFSIERGMIGQAQATAEQTIVRVASLLPHEHVQAHAVSCPGEEGSSSFVEALDVTDVPLPRVAAPLVPGQKTVKVIFVQIGARLDVLVDNRFAAGVTVTSAPAEVTLPEGLRLGQHVRARQGICGTWLSNEEDPGTPVTAPPVATPPPAAGVSKVVVFNCTAEHRTIHVWTVERDGSKHEIGTLAPNVDDWGTCTTAGAPLEVKLSDGHEYQVVFVDPDASGCDGDNDPLKVACRHQVFPDETLSVKGLSSGPAVQVIVN